jgi:hypothetical protein
LNGGDPQGGDDDIKQATAENRDLKDNLVRLLDGNSTTEGVFSDDRSPNEPSNFNRKTPREEMATSGEVLGSAPPPYSFRLPRVAATLIGSTALILLLGIAAASIHYQWWSKIGPGPVGPTIPGATIPGPTTAPGPTTQPGPRAEGPTTVPGPITQPGPRAEGPTTVPGPTIPGPIVGPPKGTPSGQMQFSSASLYCGKELVTSWEFGEVELVDPGLSKVGSCRNPSLTCKNSIMVGVGVASSKGVDTTESDRALRRGVNLASAMEKDFQENCKTEASAYIINLGRHSGDEEQDDPNQRRVIALITDGVGDDQAVATALEVYLKSHPEFDNYTVCNLYKLHDENQQSPIPTQHKICGDHVGSALSQQ